MEMFGFYYYYRKEIENLLQELAQVGLNLAQSHAIGCHILLFPRAIKGLVNIHWTGTALNTQYAVYRPHPGFNEVVRGLNRSLFFPKSLGEVISKRDVFRLRDPQLKFSFI